MSTSTYKKGYSEPELRSKRTGDFLRKCWKAGYTDVVIEEQEIRASPPQKENVLAHLILTEDLSYKNEFNQTKDYDRSLLDRRMLDEGLFSVTRSASAAKPPRPAKKSKIIKLPRGKQYTLWQGTVARKGVRIVAQNMAKGEDRIDVEVWSREAGRYYICTSPEFTDRVVKHAFLRLHQFLSWHNSLIHEALHGEFPKIE